uniref:Uncharacterized protein n=1 Tax=Candidatus Methanomethylicus mesodigestus TaxID=1867258 RepID=A0A7C3J1L4_9CREN
MKGALVFLAVFFVGILATIANPSLPPGLSIYYALGFPQTDYLLLGYPAPVFASAILNGVIYGIVVWLIYSVVSRSSKPKQQPAPQTQQPAAPKQ